MNKIFNYVGGPGAVGLLVVRLVFGIGIAMHGYQKVTSHGGPFGWFGPGTPAIFQGLATLSEFGGGLAIIFGVLTQLAALGLMFTMAYATFFMITTAHAPFIAAPGSKDPTSFEPAIGYLAIALLMLFTGPGSISVDAFIAKAIRKNKD